MLSFIIAVVAVFAVFVAGANAYEWLRDKSVRDYERCMPQYDRKR